MKQSQVLITDDVHPDLISGLEDMGYQVDYQPMITAADCFSMIDSYTGLVLNSKIIVDAAFMNQAKHLKWVARLGSGLEIIDQVEASMRGIVVINSPEGNRNAVGEHLVGMLLSIARNLNQADQQIRQGLWLREQNRGFELKGKTIGIIGFGNNGQAFAEKLAGFEVQVLAYDKYKQHIGEGMRYVESCELDYLQKHSDIISWHVPLTAETLKMGNSDFFKACKVGVIILNASRGKVIALKDLVEALDSGQVRAACLDVFENEQIAHFTDEEKTIFGRLAEMKNVILSPHIAGWTHESKREIAHVLLRKLDKMALELNF
ncbi:MAG: NAD(P)-dependent oxidoreductase [Saprospiraceae bacterium]